jgi:xanthine dehydrogenase accessory factor
MTDLEHILPLWRELEETGADYVLATIVAVEGSSYRRPGARMLLAQDGRRAGTVSGGCLEAEVARRAWWLTGDGPVVERYSTLDDDGDPPYGSGCGGVVYILLERRKTASPLLHALVSAFHARTSLAIAAVLEGPHIGQRAYAGLDAPRFAEAPSFRQVTSETTRISEDQPDSLQSQLQKLADQALEDRIAIERTITIEGTLTSIWADYRAARPGVWIFGAGDDARPLMRLARELGWFVAVADGRSHLATQARFATADLVRALPIDDLPRAAGKHLPLLPSDAAVLMTHSFEQDSCILASLLQETGNSPIFYLGVLGPQRRTREALVEAARLLHLEPNAHRIERWLAQIHAPTGIDLGADTPASIALSILAEIQQTLNAATALPLRQVRAARVPLPQD